MDAEQAEKVGKEVVEIAGLQVEPPEDHRNHDGRCHTGRVKDRAKEVLAAQVAVQQDSHHQRQRGLYDGHDDRIPKDVNERLDEVLGLECFLEVLKAVEYGRREDVVLVKRNVEGEQEHADGENEGDHQVGSQKQITGKHLLALAPVAPGPVHDGAGHETGRHTQGKTDDHKPTT